MYLPRTASSLWTARRSAKAEVEETVTTSQPGLISSACYVVVDGFDAAALGIVPSDLTGTPSHNPTLTVSVTGMAVVPTSLLAEDVSLPATTQRFTWECAAQFDTTQNPPIAFNTVPITVTLTASIAGLTSAPATIQLVAEADPYELDGPTWWLSEDLRVFQVTAGGALQGLSTVTLENTGNAQTDAPTFIKAVIDGFNADTTQPPNHPFDLISTDELVSQVTLDQYNPPTSTTPVYNFAMARVRYQSTEQSELVRVFFRIFQAATTSTAYGPNTCWLRVQFRSEYEWQDTGLWCRWRRKCCSDSMLRLRPRFLRPDHVGPARRRQKCRSESASHRQQVAPWPTHILDAGWTSTNREPKPRFRLSR